MHLLVSNSEVIRVNKKKLIPGNIFFLHSASLNSFCHSNYKCIQKLKTIYDVFFSGAVTGMSNLLPKEDKAEVEAKKRRKKREAAQNPDHGLTEGNQEEADSYDLIMKEEDANLHRFFDDLYEYVFIFKKAFRRAVKNYYSIMWINKESALADAEQFFRKVIIEWEPFDVERYLLKYCKHEKYLLDEDKLKAVRSFLM